MRILVKILLFPVVAILSILVLVLRFLHGLSSLLLSILSGIFCFAAVGTWIGSMTSMAMFQSYTGWDIVTLFIMAFVCSPYGLPLIAGFLVELLDAANGAIKAI